MNDRKKKMNYITNELKQIMKPTNSNNNLPTNKKVI